MKKYSTVLALQFVLSVAANGQTKAFRDGTSMLKVIDATEQHILPGRPESETEIVQHVIVVWKSKYAPGGFFWRGSDGFTACNFYKIKTNKDAGPGPSKGDNWYTAIDKLPVTIKKGDTLEITPVYGTKTSMPKNLPANITNTVFFKTTGTSWYYAPVKFRRLKDIAMP
ncbi:MAG: hypothetical protein JST82_02345 [Bacteroidetes bacterium]|nr:hypothetical protein [Bacteroidota bacterium]